MLRSTWIRLAATALLSGLLAAPRATLAQAASASSQATHEIRFAENIAAFLERDRVSPPPRDGILFIGSSIFRQWTDVEQDMAPLPAFNRAFGGSRTWEVLHYMDKIVLPYRPRIIVYYCGSNDVNAGESAEAITGRFKDFVARVEKSLPGTKVFFVSINRAPEKRARWNVVDAANAQIEAFAKASSTVDYIDVNPALFDAKGEPRLDLYVEDQLHLRRPAYVEFTKIIKPVLASAWGTTH
jgi:hypothetical protein